MVDLKRKRSPEDPDSAQTARCANTPYFDGMPDGIAELADVKLLVQGHGFPVHSYMLRESPVLVAAVSAARDDKQRVCQVPLPGESRQHVLLVLKYLYKDDPAVQTVQEAQALATFAHKYNMTRLHKLSEAYLTETLTFTKTNVFGWAELSERIELNVLLAHCEQFIILNFRSMSAAEKNVFSLSQSSLLRVMDGLAGREVSDIELKEADHDVHIYFCGSCSRLSGSHPGRPCPEPCGVLPYKCRVSAVQKSAAQGLLTEMVPTVESLLRWRKTGDTKQQFVAQRSHLDPLHQAKFEASAS